MRTQAETRQFIQKNTELVRVPSVPELRLHLATDATPLWTATQSWLDSAELPLPFWAFAWAGGQGLARFILDQPEVVRGRRVLDVASGSGIVGIAAMLAGAERVECWDLDPIAATAMALNAGANNVALEVRSRAAVDAVGDAEVIVAGDVWYERDMALSITQWLVGCATEGRTVLVGDPARTYAPHHHRTWLHTCEVEVAGDLEKASSCSVYIWRITAAA